jgi:protein SCO1/2
MNKFKIVAGVLALATLSACGKTPAESPPLAGAKMGGAFRLTNQDGKAVTDADFAGKYRLMYFGYTFCPDVCPVDVQAMGTRSGSI